MKTMIRLITIVALLTLSFSLYMEKELNRFNQLEIDRLENKTERLEKSVNNLSLLVENNDDYQPICSLNTFKSYMDYRTITNTYSQQYKLQQYATTEYNNGLRVVDGLIMVAMAGYDVGTILVIGLDSGTELSVIIGDVKDAGHDGCKSLRDGSMIEFIVDFDYVPSYIKRLGNFNELFSGSVMYIKLKGVYEYE